MKTLITILVFIVSGILVQAQTQEAITTNGKKVILSNDGTWKYLELKTDTSKSSDCSNWIQTVKDKVDGSIITCAKNTIVVSQDGKIGFGISLYLNEKPTKGIILIIQVAGAEGCIDENAKINILFTDDTKIEFRANGKFDCEGKVVVYFKSGFGKATELEQLRTKKIQTMRIWDMKSYTQQDFTDENKQEFMNVINCLMK
jgi:hypothetical protein